jgi:amino acid transporter
MKENQPVTSGLKKVLGFPSLLIISIGLVVSQSSVVSIIQGAGIGGGSFLFAILIAYVLTLCYIATYSELALMMPKAGSISTYTSVSIGHFPAIIAAIAANLAPAVFAGPAELLLLQHVLDSVAPVSFPHIALLLLFLLTLLNILGIDLFASIQSVITYTMLVTLFVIGFTGLNPAIVNGATPAQIWVGFIHAGSPVFSLVVISLWAFLSFELICPLIEETKQPEKNIPKAMFMASLVMFIGYNLLAFTALRQVPVEQLVNTDIPHVVLAQALFGNPGKIIAAVLAITTTTGLINAVLAAVPRVLYGMAHHKHLPPVFMKLHPKWKTPWFGILFLSALTIVPLLLFENNPDFLLLLLISSASCWLVTYIIAHINVMVLRKRYPLYNRPFKSPFYPLPQVIGILSMGYAIYNNAPTAELTWKVYLNSGIFLGISATYAFFWVRYKMKKGLLDPEPIEQALKD